MSWNDIIKITFILDYLIETVNEMELMNTGDQRCTDFLLEAMTFHLVTSEQKAKHCRNVSFSGSNRRIRYDSQSSADTGWTP